MLKLKLQYFGHLMRTDSLEKPWRWERLKAKEKRAAEDEMLDSITNSMDMNLSKFRETVKDKEALCAAGHKELDMT